VSERLEDPATLNPRMDDTPFRVCQLATARMLQDQTRSALPLVHASAERPQFADVSFDFATSDAGAVVWCDPLSMDPRSGADPKTWRRTPPACRPRLADAEHKRPTVHPARVRENGWGDVHVLPAYEWAQFAVAEEHYFVLAGRPVEIN
jgi:hypothetical protein